MYKQWQASRYGVDEHGQPIEPKVIDALQAENKRLRAALSTIRCCAVELEIHQSSTCQCMGCNNVRSIVRLAREALRPGAAGENNDE